MMERQLIPVIATLLAFSARIVYHRAASSGKSFCCELPRTVAPSAMYKVMLDFTKMVPVRYTPGGKYTTAPPSSFPHASIAAWMNGVLINIPSPTAPYSTTLHVRLFPDAVVPEYSEVFHVRCNRDTCGPWLERDLVEFGRVSAPTLDKTAKQRMRSGVGHRWRGIDPQRAREVGWSSESLSDPTLTRTHQLPEWACFLVIKFFLCNTFPTWLYIFQSSLPNHMSLSELSSLPIFPKFLSIQHTTWVAS